ncbi:MAG: 8-oxo-dGTP diphosphatase MutT [Verrucomicrobia bacterium]|nr:8-oxo-dGTP diphosphatase MutT [Verrucomicrobiota bacterium]
MGGTSSIRRKWSALDSSTRALDAGSEQAGSVDRPPPIAVAAGLVFQAGRLLITRRPEGAHLGGLWEFPGGKLEPGETWEAGLARELHEELGITVTVDRLVCEVTHAYPDRTVHLRFFACRLAAGEPRALGCAAFAWVRREDLARHEFPPADAAVLDAVRSAPEFSGESL